MTSNNLRFSGKIKVPKVYGCAHVQKLVRPEGAGDDVSEWEVQHEEQTDNVVLDQGRAFYGLYRNYDAVTISGGNVSGNSHLAFEDIFNKIYVSEDDAPPDSTNTSMAADAMNPSHSFTPSGGTVSDAGEYNNTNGIGYTKISRGVIFYQEGVTVPFTINKIYGHSAVGNPLLDAVLVLPGYNTTPQSELDIPISELLLGTSATINDADKEAIKIVYSIYFPRMHSVGDTSTWLSIGSSSITIDDYSYSQDPSTATPTQDTSINWTIKYAAHKDAFASYNIGSMGQLATKSDLTDGDLEFKYDIQGSGNPYNKRPLLAGSATISEGTKSITYSVSQKVAHQGSPNTSENFSTMSLVPLQKYTLAYVEFASPLTIQWSQDFTIEADITIDWS